MLSRVADSLYWMGRYLERAEHTARITGVHLNLMLEYDAGADGDRWTRLLRVLGCSDPPQGDAFNVAESYALDQIATAIASARENARQVREHISSELWEELNRLFHDSKTFQSEPHELLILVVQRSHLLQGVTDSTMLHGEGWEFIQAGRFIERVQETVRLVDEHFREFYRGGGEPMSMPHSVEWIGLLRSCTAFEAYCKVYTAEMRPERVVEFLLLNADFPHSVRFGVDHLGRSLDAIHQASGTRKSDRIGKLAGRLTSTLRYTPLDEVVTGLPDFAAGIRKLCGQIHSGIYQVYVTYPIDSALDS